MAEENGRYVLIKGDAVTARYTPTGSPNQFNYTYSLDTLLRVDGGTYTLCLPNVSTMTTDDGQTIALGTVQTKKLTVTADAADNLTGESAAFAASPPRELTF